MVATQLVKLHFKMKKDLRSDELLHHIKKLIYSTLKHLKKHITWPLTSAQNVQAGINIKQIDHAAVVYHLLK